MWGYYKNVTEIINQFSVQMGSPSQTLDLTPVLRFPSGLLGPPGTIRRQADTGDVC